MTEDKAARVWRRFKEVMQYSEEDLTKFKANPKFMQMFNTPAFRTHKIVAEVIQSHGCVCQHIVGQRLVLNGNGALIRDECPPIMCVGLVSQLMPVIFALYERVTAGLDPNGLLFDTIACTDVGIECGGWGRVLSRVHVEGPQGR
ncbi:hypothetical protein ACFLWI_07475 [Chloroflexota bacterium]